MTPARATKPGPLLLPNNQFAHFYRGGDRIAALRGGPGGPRRPEEWIASATTRFAHVRQGLSVLADGSLLRERVLTDPVAWLGPDHVQRYGGYGMELLVKLIDAGQRLPVHLHPDRAFAREHLGLSHGKTEAWHVLQAEPGAVVGLGFREPVDAAQVAGWVRAHDTGALVAAVHQLEVSAGESVLVPAGTPHFIGAGVLVMELQEPTDLSILLEWEGMEIDGDTQGHLGLGFDVALGALDRRAWSERDLGRVRCPAPADAEAGGLMSLLPGGASAYFRLHRLAPRGTSVAVPPGLGVLLVVDGEGEVETAEAGTHAVRRGDALLLPWAAGNWAIAGAVTALLARPPAPDAPQGR